MLDETARDGGRAGRTRRRAAELRRARVGDCSARVADGECGPFTPAPAHSARRPGRPPGGRSRREAEPPADDARSDGPALFTEGLDVQRDRLLGVRCRLIEGVPLGVHTGKVRGVNGVASSVLRLEDHLDLMQVRHGDIVCGWFAYAPLQRSCGPPVRRAELAGHLATTRLVGPVRPLHGVPEPCLGALAVHVGGAELVASALGPRASVRSFVDSVDLAHASR